MTINHILLNYLNGNDYYLDIIEEDESLFKRFIFKDVLVDDEVHPLIQLYEDIIAEIIENKNGDEQILPYYYEKMLFLMFGLNYDAKTCEVDWLGSGFIGNIHKEFQKGIKEKELDYYRQRIQKDGYKEIGDYYTKIFLQDLRFLQDLLNIKEIRETVDRLKIFIDEFKSYSEGIDLLKDELKYALLKSTKVTQKKEVQEEEMKRDYYDFIDRILENVQLSDYEPEEGVI